MPQDSGYRKNTEALVTARAQIVTAAKTPSEIEEKIDCGQVEELIVQAENELTLARNMLVWKPWEPLLTHAPENQWKWPPPN